MKKTNLITVFLAFLLAGCDISFGFGSSSTSNSNSTSRPISISDVSTNISEDTSLSTSNSISNSSQEEIRKMNIYGINDFHGAVLENYENQEPGIVKLGSYLIDKKKEGNTLLINSGDMWQGAIESNYNYGNLLTDCMNMIGFDCFTLGNHEFDWGEQYIRANRERSYNGYQTPFLAANIYNYDINTKETKDFANLGSQYTITTLNNGLRVGIIGVIGENQITSICSQFADDFTFVNPTSIIKSLSDELRNEQNVDVVILDCHTDQETIGTDVTTISNVTNKRYVDAVFCAHTHQDETQIINGVPYLQTNGYGKLISTVELEISINGDVSCTNYENISAYSATSTSYNEKLDELVQTYKVQSDAVGNEVLGNLSGSLYSSSSLPNFVSRAMAYACDEQGFNISYAITNSGRANLESGNITYANLYRSLPFDNEIYIIKVSGSVLKKELEMNSISFYRKDVNALSTNKQYTIAVIDYLAFHRNVSRDYNYFPNLEIVGKLTKTGSSMYNYRDITADFIRQNSGTLNYRDYLDTVDRHNPGMLTSSI